VRARDDPENESIAGVVEMTPWDKESEHSSRITEHSDSVFVDTDPTMRGMSTEAWNQVRRIITAFEVEWEQGREPAVEAYLTGAGISRAVLLAELLQTDLEYRLRAGLGCRVSEYLDRYPELGTEAAADLVVRDYKLRREAGSSVSPARYLGEFPKLKTELERRFAALTAPDDRLASATVKASSPAAAQTPLVRLPKKFQVVEKLGEGGMGVVWRVRRHDLNIDRAVKLIHPNFAFDAETRARMMREAQAMARISHRHAVMVHDVGTDPVPYIEMEFIRGQPLNKLLERGVPMPLDWTARILQQICDVLQATHDHGIVHRDLKPSNLMIENNDCPGKEFVKVLDFGIAKFLQASDLTPNDMKLGTVLYMSPEQVTDSSGVSPSSDIYTIGVILYELLTGCLPFTSRIPKVFYDITYTKPPGFGEINPKADVPAEIEELVLRCLAKEPGQRPPSARALADEFCRLVFPAPPPPPTEVIETHRVSRRLIVVAMLPALGVGSFAVYRATRPVPYLLKPGTTKLKVQAGKTGEISILVRPENRASQVRVSTDSVLPGDIGIVEDEAQRTGELRRFLVKSSVNAHPGRYVLAFRGSVGRTRLSTSIELEIEPPRLGELPPHWTASGKVAELVQVGEVAYPRTIERVVDGESVIALLIPQEHFDDPAPFYMMRDKVWEKLFERYARETGRKPEPDDKWRTDGGDRLPVLYLTGYEAQAFAEWLGGKGHGFLPTPAQWDQAAGKNRKSGRGGPFIEGTARTKTQIQDASREWKPGDPPPTIAVGFEMPLPVGLATADISPFGCRDMSGNGEERTRLPPQDPKNPDIWIEVRGQAFKKNEPYTFKNGGNDVAPFDSPEPDIGFRVVIEIGSDA
jgi:serine/threonine protein kinase